MAYIGAPPPDRILTTEDIEDGAVEMSDISWKNQSANENLSGTIDSFTVKLAEKFTLTCDIAISKDLTLTKLADDGEALVLTTDASSRTIEGSGTISSNTFAQVPNASLTSMTGVLDNSVQDNITRLGTVTSGTIGSAVTGSPALNTVNFTNQACFAVYNSGSNQDLGTADTWLTWTSNQSDVDNLNGRNNDYYEIKEAGYYFVHGQVTFGGQMYDSQYNAVALFVNSTETTSAYIGGEFSQTDVATATVSFIKNLSIGDKIYLKAQHSGNTNTSLLNGTDRQTQLIGFKLFI